jgi:transcriptional regulator with XRE-family HTH domain
MNNRRRPFGSVLIELANRPQQREQFVLANSQVNGSELARELGVSQATMSRALKNPKYQPRKDFVDAVARVFEISVAQARGEESLTAQSADDGRLSSRTRNFAKRYEKLLPDQKKIIDDMVGQLEIAVHRQQQLG